MGIWIRRTPVLQGGERYAIATTRGTRRISLNYWHLKDGHVNLFTFIPNKKYNKHKNWTEELYKELEEDLSSVKPSVKILKKAIDQNIVYVADGSHDINIPKIPLEPQLPKGWDKHLERQQKKELHEKKKRLEEERSEGNYVVYGRYLNEKDERRWRLSRKTKSVMPGDLIMVDTGKGAAVATVTRVEREDHLRVPKYSAMRHIQSIEEYKKYIERKNQNKPA